MDGMDVKQCTDASLRAQIGIVPQKAVLFQGTIRENLQWGKEDATDAELYQALEIAQAREIVEKKPESWTNVLPKMQAICPADSGSG